MRIRTAVILAMSMLLVAVPTAAYAEPTLESVGKAIFFDTNLSSPPGQSCSSCHDPVAGFADPDGDAISPGAVPGRFGNRNAPMSAYASYIPTFSFDTTIGAFTGGQFWDGRADTLEEQAKGPFLNPLEMHMPNERAVVARLSEASYADDFRTVFGPSSLSVKDAVGTYDRIAQAVAAYERTVEMNSFSSKHDYAMTRTGPARMMTFTMQERQGMMLFNGSARCWVCHVTPMGGMMGGGMGMVPNQLILFSDYRFSNLGIPKNPDNPYYTLNKKLNPEGAEWVDHGLAAVMPGGVEANPQLDGLFKTPSLRNVALTAPYGHNGYFKTLKEVVHFYNTRDVPGAGWPAAEVPANVDTENMGNLGLTSAEEDAIVAFLGTLSDGWWTPPTD